MLLSGYVSADILTSGIKIDVARVAMEKAGYKKSGLDWAVRDRSHSLDFWSVSGGTLVALYSKKSNEIISFSYNLSDERPKSLRKEFDFGVISFDTVTKQMTIQTKPEPQAKPIEQKLPSIKLEVQH